MGLVRLSLSQQFVLATVTLTVAVLVASLLLARWSFSRGFAAYVDTLELRRLEVVGQLLLEHYDTRRGWADLTERQFERAVLRLPQKIRPRHRPRPLDGPDRGRRPPPPHEAPPGPTPEGLPEIPRSGPDILAVPTTLLDAAGNYLMGTKMAALIGTGGEIEGYLSLPLLVEDAVVGELRSLPRRRLRLADESAFVRSQGLASLGIFVVALALAVAMSLLLSRRLLAPLRQAHTALGSLAAGDYQARLGSARADELGDLMRDIDVLGETLEQNQGARRRWIADISHELRTPIAILKGELEAMADGIRPFDTHQLASLQMEVRRLAKLVDDLYQLSLADLGGLRYEFRALDLADLVESLVADYQPRLQATGLTLSTELDSVPAVRGDGQRLEQLLRNLLENSLAYTDAPGQLRITVAARAGTVMLRVEDSAPGVAADHCAELFEPLYREDASRSRRSAGAGLGLAICRAVVEAHGGRITASPSELGGLQVDTYLQPWAT